MSPHLMLNSANQIDFEKPLIIFDRDNTLIVDAGQNNQIENLKFLPGALHALRLCFLSGFGVAIVTNQAGVGRKLFDLETLDEFHNSLISKVYSETSGHISAIVSCPHLPEDGCECRKPKSGMISILRATGFSKIRVLFGDKPSDVKAAEAAVIDGVQIENEKVLEKVKDWLGSHDLS